MGGCLPDCSGPSNNFSCSQGSPSSPSVCVCLTGYSLNNSLCLPKCGDSMVIGDEKCDDGLKGSCKSDCSGSNDGY